MIVYFFFQGNEEDSYETIGTKRATPLFVVLVFLVVVLVAHYEGTGMIGTATAADDEEVLVILRSVKSAVSHFVADKKYLST